MNMTGVARKIAFPVVVFAILLSLPAQSAVTISTGATQNIACAAGICTATAADAVLNVSDLQTMLASSDVKVATGTVTDNINVGAALTWVSSSTLTLDASHSIRINEPISVTGSGGVVIVTSDGTLGGKLWFRKKGEITFWSTSDNLTINGIAYTLINNLATLRSAVAAKPNGNFAFSNDYNAKQDGIYVSSPVYKPFTGSFDGLGHTIRHLVIRDKSDANIGLFAEVDSGGSVRNIGLNAADITGNSLVHFETIGALVGTNSGQITNCYVKGSVAASGSTSYNMSIGGLAGSNAGAVIDSYAEANIFGAGGARIGGLIGGQENGSTTTSHSAGAVNGGSSGGAIGGLVGNNWGFIVDSYSTSSVAGGPQSSDGGLVGYDGWVGQPATIHRSYATGNVSGGNDSNVGGLVGLSTHDVINNSYATGSVAGEYNEAQANLGVGGLVGKTGYKANIRDSYSIGTVTSASGTGVGAVIGYRADTILIDLYWDKTTSGITDSSKGTGNISNDPGVVSLTTIQLQSGIPMGFDPSIWGENPSINGGLPYLLDNPPPG